MTNEIERKTSSKCRNNYSSFVPWGRPKSSSSSLCCAILNSGSGSKSNFATDFHCGISCNECGTMLKKRKKVLIKNFFFQRMTI